MYIPNHHAESRLESLHALIRSYPLGTWVTLGDGELIANHVPFLLDTTRGEFGTLVGHLARANPVWQVGSRSIPSVVAFQGAQTYITPSWYPSKQEHGRTVPTWNYAVVHVHGQPTVIDDRGWLYAHVCRLTDAHEATQAMPWQVADAPADFMEALMRAIVGLEIPIQRIEGKWKTSQNRPERDRQGVVAGLLGQDDSQAAAMAALVRQSLAP